MNRIRLTHLDGKLPNLALMRLAHWHRFQGDDVILARTPSPSLFEPPAYHRVYASAIFSWSAPSVRKLLHAFPSAIIGGTGSGQPLDETVEAVIGVPEYEHYDYSIYPDYRWSIGFTQRGCRLNCGFCIVPKKEGRPKTVNTIHDIWRPGTERNVVLLDNDFFGQPEEDWKARTGELAEGRFKVNFNQGINIRLITPQAARVLASLRYYDHKFRRRRLYTAWDNLKQESVFFRGLELLQEAGIPPKHIMVYMLIGYRPGETMDDILYRFHRLNNTGCLPYPMVYDNSNQTLKAFQRWVIRRYHQFIPWEQYAPSGRKPEPYQPPAATANLLSPAPRPHHPTRT